MMGIPAVCTSETRIPQLTLSGICYPVENHGTKYPDWQARKLGVCLVASTVT